MVYWTFAQTHPGTIDLPENGMLTLKRISGEVSVKGYNAASSSLQLA